VYIGNVPYHCNEGNVRAVFEAIGPIANCQLKEDIKYGGHRGFGFVDYESSQCAIQAHSAPPGRFVLDGNPLTISRIATSCKGPPRTFPPREVMMDAQPPNLQPPPYASY
jgi:hypothetical protein